MVSAVGLEDEGIDSGPTFGAINLAFRRPGRSTPETAVGVGPLEVSSRLHLEGNGEEQPPEE